MALHHGNEGEVDSGANQVLEVTEFTYDENVTIAAHKAIGDTAESYYPDGIKSAGGSITAKYDPDDSTGQATLTPGASITLTLYPFGNSSGNDKLTGTAVIESVSKSHSVGDLLGITFAYKGVLTLSTIP